MKKKTTSPKSARKPAESQQAVAHGRAVLAREIEGLKALSAALDRHFVNAVNTISRVCHEQESKGRLIVTGMGKSGHISAKIAATLASTGTPSHFVHPAEASHGDLGMITAHDCVLALSNSGETKELTDIVAHTKRVGAPLIAMVRRKASMLSSAADIALVLPDTPEASPTGAPTTSTTMMLALGDAIAVALLEKRGFTKEDFGRLHPGGKLGAAFTRVQDVMHKGKELPLVSPDAPMREVLLEMTARRFGCAAVVDKKGVLLGIITDGDLRRHMRADLLSLSALKVMTKSPVTIRPAALAAEALGIMNTRGITSLFVCEAGKPVGILHIHDCLRAGIS